MQLRRWVLSDYSYYSNVTNMLNKLKRLPKKTPKTQFILLNNAQLSGLILA